MKVIGIQRGNSGKMSREEKKHFFLLEAEQYGVLFCSKPEKITSEFISVLI